MKKITAIFMVLLMLFAFASCKDNSIDEKETTQSYTEQESVENSSASQNESVSVSSSVTSAETESASSTVAETVPVSLHAETDPSKWSNEEIVAFYKAAAIKSKTKVKSTQKMTLAEMVVNNGDGVLGTLVEWITPFLIDALEKNSTEFDGITGGYENLEVSDTTSVKAYRSGNYTIVEMTMKEQTDGAHGDLHSGTVGHAISVVGDLAVVEEALPNFEIGFEEADIKLHYQNPKLKVKINDEGIIEKGTWSYKVYITVANLYVAAKKLPISATVDSGYGSVDYVITVGGGF